MKPPRVTSSEVVYENRWMRVREDRLERADGSPGLYSVVEKRPAAVILPLHDDDTVTLVEQYRHPVGARSWELPQGALDGVDVSDSEQIARTELAEETGLRAADLRHLSRLYFAAGISSQYFDAWLATGLTEGEQALEAEEEGLRVGRFPLAEVERMAREGEIIDAATVAVLGLLRGVRRV
ncbi:MAG TPA: NUDIX hydrolase [Thermoleophilaceae bacterium]|nr:NUDIX hydrolase [Thermoleophilaceae bacterium]